MLLPVTVVPRVELSVCRVSTVLSTVTVCVTAPTSSAWFAVAVSVTCYRDGPYFGRLESCSSELEPVVTWRQEGELVIAGRASRGGTHLVGVATRGRHRAPAIAPPDASVTIPLIAPFPDDCACASGTQSSSAKRRPTPKTHSYGPKIVTSLASPLIDRRH